MENHINCKCWMGRDMRGCREVGELIGDGRIKRCWGKGDCVVGGVIR